jgi:hypothetical protein
MATFSAVFAPSTANSTVKVSALAGATSSAEIDFNKDAKIVIIASPNAVSSTLPGVFVKFGQAGMSAADATGFFIPINTYVSFDLSNAWTAVRFFNQDPSVAVNIYIMQLAN